MSKLKNDAEWLSKLAELPEGVDSITIQGDKLDILRRIARNMGKIEMAMFAEDSQIEKTASAAMQGVVHQLLTSGEDVATEDCRLIMMWLLERRIARAFPAHEQSMESYEEVCDGSMDQQENNTYVCDTCGKTGLGFGGCPGYAFGAHIPAKEG